MNLQSRKQRARDGAWALLVLRLVVGFGFAAHGEAKLARGVEHFAQTLTAMGIPAPAPMAWVTTLVELLGGLSLMAGGFVAPLCVPLGIVMLTALFGVHLRYGFSSVRLRAITAAGVEFGPVGYELNLLYLAALVVLALSSPGPFSLDAWLAKRRHLTATTSAQKPAQSAKAVTLLARSGWKISTKP